MQNLPEFQKNVFPAAKTLADAALSFQGKSLLYELVEYEDGHFRAIFDQSYFILPEGQSEPSKSQWNTLKKRFKRVNPHVFIFKDYGIVDNHYYIDFGFYKGSAQN